MDTRTATQLQGFVGIVSRAIGRVGASGRFGTKVFIAAVREAANANLTEALAWSQDEFAAWLLDAHRAGLVVLSRADLTSAMDPKLVAESQITYLGIVDFHFVRLAP